MHVPHTGGQHTLVSDPFQNGCFLLQPPGDHLFKGFHGKAELSNESFAELDDHHHLGHVDAAFRMHFENSTDHDHMFFFLVQLAFLIDDIWGSMVI